MYHNYLQLPVFAAIRPEDANALKYRQAVLKRMEEMKQPPPGKRGSEEVGISMSKANEGIDFKSTCKMLCHFRPLELAVCRLCLSIDFTSMTLFPAWSSCCT